MHYKPSIIIALLFLVTGCHPSRKFDHAEWISYNGTDGASDREAMVTDLINNYHLKGASSLELKKLLGNPNGSDSSVIWYEVKVDYGLDIDPVYVKDLIIHLNKHSIATDVRLKEWKK